MDILIGMIFLATPCIILGWTAAEWCKLRRAEKRARAARQCQRRIENAESAVDYGKAMAHMEQLGLTPARAESIAVEPDPFQSLSFETMCLPPVKVPPRRIN